MLNMLALGVSFIAPVIEYVINLNQRRCTESLHVILEYTKD